MSKPHPLTVTGSANETRYANTKHEIWQPLPCKMITVSVSGSGKTSVLLAAIGAVFEQMDYFAIFSHSHTLDVAWGDLKDKIREKYMRTGIDPERNPCWFDNLTSLDRVLAQQRDRVQELKDAEPPVSKLPQLLVVVDDALGETMYNKSLDNLFSRGRHFGVNAFCGSQIYKGLSSTIRKNADVLTIHRLPEAEYVAVSEELSGTWVTKQQFRELYEAAVGAHPYGFLTVRMKSRDPKKMFYADFSRRLIPH